MGDGNLIIGDLVWAKMKGFSPWPGKITNPLSDMKKPKSSKLVYCVWFFGSNNYAWIDELSIKPYEKYKEKLVKASRSTAFREALNQIEDYIARKEAGEDVDKELEERASQQGANDMDDDDTEAMASESENEVLSDAESGIGKKRRATSTDDHSSDEKKPTREEDQNQSHETPLQIVRRLLDEVERFMKNPYSGSSSGTTSAGPPRKKKAIQENGESTPKATPKKGRPRASSGLGSERGTDKSASKVSNHAQRKSAAANLLNRPTSLMKPDAVPLDVSNVSQTLKDKQITPSQLKFGFLGLGIMGSGMVKNLLNSGHQVVVWNRTPDKCNDFVNAGADRGMTPSDVVNTADITFSCLSDPLSSKEMFFGNCGVLTELDANKGYVEMTGTDADSSQDIADAVASKGARYMEAQIQGSKTESEEGTLVIMAAGDRSLYEDCQSAFQSMSKNSFFLGAVGNASKMNLVLEVIQGIALSGLAEGMALADRANLQQRDVLEILNLTSLSCNMMRDKGQAIMEGSFPVHQPLQHMQKDMNMALNLGHQLEQPLPLAATANEVFKHAKRLGHYWTMSNPPLEQYGELTVIPHSTVCDSCSDCRSEDHPEFVDSTTYCSKCGDVIPHR